MKYVLFTGLLLSISFGDGLLGTYQGQWQDEDDNEVGIEKMIFTSDSTYKRESIVNSCLNYESQVSYVVEVDTLWKKSEQRRYKKSCSESWSDWEFREIDKKQEIETSDSLLRVNTGEFWFEYQKQ